jgi:hypothetical protein
VSPTGNMHPFRFTMPSPDGSVAAHTFYAPDKTEAEKYVRLYAKKRAA